MPSKKYITKGTWSKGTTLIFVLDHSSSLSRMHFVRNSKDFASAFYNLYTVCPFGTIKCSNGFTLTTSISTITFFSDDDFKRLQSDTHTSVDLCYFTLTLPMIVSTNLLIVNLENLTSSLLCFEFGRTSTTLFFRLSYFSIFRRCLPEMSK